MLGCRGGLGPSSFAFHHPVICPSLAPTLCAGLIGIDELLGNLLGNACFLAKSGLCAAASIKRCCWGDFDAMNHLCSRAAKLVI